MSRLFYHTMQDSAGNLLFDVSGTMRMAGTGTIATIYGDEALTVILPNPMTNHASFGSFKCYLGAGAYDFYMAKTGYTFETLTGLQGWGTMALQNASAVTVTGGTVNTLSSLSATDAFFTVANHDRVGAGLVSSAARVAVGVSRASYDGIIFRPDGDTGSFVPLRFLNAAGTQVGHIDTSATMTTYATTSDARLKHAITAMTGALDVVRALRPVAFRWNADESPGVGFLAHEVAALVQGVITGDEGAVDGEGGIVPQMIDYSKLVPFLVGAVQTLAAQVAVLEDARGV